MQSKVLITGISGLLGAKLALDFHNQGYIVSGIKREGTELPNELNEFEIHEGDICDEEFLKDTFVDVDIVIHTAAIVSFDRRDKKEMYRVNVEGTQSVVNICLQTNIKKLIYISSIAALGRVRSDLVIDESTLWEESDFNTNYGHSKFLAEMEFWRGIEEGLRGFCLNPSIILGTGNIGRSSNKIFKNIFRKYIPYVNGSINVVDERDIVDIIRLLNVKEINAERYVLNGHKLSIKDLLHNISKDAKLYLVPSILLYIGWCLDGLNSFFKGKSAQLTKETLKVLNAESTYDNSKVKTELNFTFQSLESTLKHCKGYYVNNY